MPKESLTTAALMFDVYTALDGLVCAVAVEENDMTPYQREALDRARIARDMLRAKYGWEAVRRAVLTQR